MSEFKDLIGKTLVRCDAKKYGSKVVFETDGGEIFELWHSQDCCESVNIEDICGELVDLIGSPIIQAEETSNHDRIKDTQETQSESFTWTFYRIATSKGQVVIRWYGQSNGWYSESVDFKQTK